MVHGDSEQTLRVLVAYYRQKTEPIAYTASVVKRVIVQPNSDSSIVRESILNELSKTKTDDFVQYVDDVYYSAIVKHIENGHDPSSPLVADSVIHIMLTQFERIFPFTSLVFSTASSVLKKKNNSFSTHDMKRRYLAIAQFLGMVRLRNSHKLVWWAMVESLSQISRGLQKRATINSVLTRQALSFSTVFRKLNAFTPMVVQYNRRLLQGEANLDTAFDNFQLFISKKYQRDGKSLDSIHATCRLAKRSFPVTPTVGSVLTYEQCNYLVIGVLHRETYASL